ncbi:MAG: hypothetical protein JNL98_07890 [Bryobacterales bacterium]|nr:hypothetical protein [Bryobacterales bacterium]
MKQIVLSMLLGAMAIPCTAQVQDLKFFKLVGVNGGSVANDCYINDNGTVAASIRYDQGGVSLDQAYQLNNGKTEILPHLPGYVRSIVKGINNQGEILGRLSGGGQSDFAVVVWKNKIPTPVVLPSASHPANRQVPTPIAIDNAGRILVNILELNPANQTVSQDYFLLQGSAAAKLPPLLPGGPVSNVYFYAYTSMNNTGSIAGFAQVTRLGQLRIIGFILKNGVFQEVLVDDLFGVRGINQKGEVFGDRFDGSFFVWRNGQVDLFPRLMVSTLVTTSSFNNRSETCASVRIFQDVPGAVRENAIVSFGGKGPNQ